MPDENATTPEMEVETKTTPQKSEVESDQPANEELTLDSEEGENPDSEEKTEEEIELEEAEFEGKKYKLPKELKGALLRQSDYTKKTQEIAEAKKRIDSEQQNFRQTVEAQKQEFKTYADFHNIESKISEYDKFFESPEWQEVIDNDTPRALRARDEYQKLHNQRNKHAQEISHKERERSHTQQQHVAKLEEETRSTLQREIKGWGTELESNLTSYAKSQGFADHVMSNGLKTDPVAVKTIHKAYLYDQLVKKQLAKPKIEIKPIGKIQQGKSSNMPSEFRADMSHEDYDKWRSRKRKS